MRELGPSEKVGTEQMAFAKLEGLGKIPFSNIRRPRPLMELEASQPKDITVEEVCVLSF
jgi:DNA topoisomerase 2-associated protein PAT1